MTASPGTASVWAAAVASGYRDVFGHAPRDRPYVVVNMVAGLDGGTAVEGRTGLLSSPADKAVFRHLRALADAVLVGAGTVRAEGYGTVKADAAVRDARAGRGQAPVARLAIVTRTLRLDWGGPVFTEPTARPVVIAPADAPRALLDRAGEVADVVAAGAGSVDLPGALRTLRQDHGVGRLLCEGGPVLNAQLADAGLVNGLCLTVRPVLLGTGSQGVVAGGFLREPAAGELAGVMAQDGDVFLRYRFRGGSAAD